jgi:hypothetical protein
MVLKSSERHIICGTAVIHPSEKLGIVLILEYFVIMTGKNRVNRGKKACRSNSISLISCLLHKCVCFVKKGQRRIRQCAKTHNTYWFFNPLRTKRMFYTRTQCVPRSKHSPLGL